MKRQFTATAYIIEHDRVLLIHHRKFNKWLPPGGHLEPDETPQEAAEREAFEETGLEIELIPDELVWVEQATARSLVRPFMCLLEEIPAYGNEPSHQHMDMVFLARVKEGSLKENPQETLGIRWFTPQEVEQLIPDQEIFIETQEVVKTIFNTLLHKVL